MSANKLANARRNVFLERPAKYCLRTGYRISGLLPHDIACASTMPLSALVMTTPAAAHNVYRDRHRRALFHFPCDADRLRITEQAHEAVVHVQVLMTVKKREAGIVCHEVGLDAAEWIHKHNILDDARRGFAMDFHKFEAVPVQMHGMRVIGFVRKCQSIAQSL